MLTINVVVLLAVIILLRLRRRTQARSRTDEQLTVAIVLVFGLLLAPTDMGQGIVNIVDELVSNLSQTENP